MILIGLDVSSAKVGWCKFLTPNNLVIDSGVIKLDKKMPHLDRMLWLQGELTERFLCGSEVELILVEKPPFMMGKSASAEALTVMIGYVTATKLICHSAGIKLDGLYPKQIRATLKYKGPGGKKSKKILHKHYIDLFPNTFKEGMLEDEIDAIALALAYCEKF